MGLLVVL